MEVLRKRILGSLPGRRAQDLAARGNKYAAAAMKKEWTGFVALNFANSPRIEEPVRVICNWYCKDRRQDPDNIASAKKFLMDGLQVAGVLPNDGWKNIVGFIDNFFIDKRNPGVEVILRTIN